MKSKINEVNNRKTRPYAKIVAALLCLLLMLISLVIVSANSYAATTHQVTQNSNTTPTITGTSAITTITGTSASPTITNTSVTTPSTTSATSHTPTPTDTPTSTPTPTNTPTPIPTNTPTPKPTPTPRPTATPTPPPATATPTALATATSTIAPTATAKSTATTKPVTTPTTNATQTPTPISGVPTTVTNNSTGGGNNNTPPTPSGSGFNLPIATITISLLVFLGLAGALLIGFTLVSRRLLPSPTPQAGNLPPSGAQPWRRTRAGSLDSTTEVRGDWNSWLLHSGMATVTPEARTQSPSGTLAQAPNQGYTMPNNNAFPPLVPGAHPNNAYQPIPAAPNTGVFPNTTNVFPSPAIGPHPTTNALPQPAIADREPRPYTPMPSPANNELTQVKAPEQFPPASAIFSVREQKTVSDLLTVAEVENTGPLTNQIKISPRQHNKPIRLKNIQNNDPSQNIHKFESQYHDNERNSEELPSINDISPL